MKTFRYIPRVLPLALILAMTACTGNPPANSNQRAASANSANVNSANASQSNTSQSKPSQQTSSTTGTIEVTSTPPGAKVLLVPNDESGASEPQPKGLTPAMISGVAPGKYTVDLEKPGYRFYQKEVVVKEGGNIKVNAILKKQ